mmetsp:Transcript_56751/g.128639  ORF Transcript_56751/g.128639 Transcript_56751/m.128639 type:complete len:135 (+) Transcript_56751:634-1038(+)
MVLLTFGVSVEPRPWRATMATAQFIAGLLQTYLFMAVHEQWDPANAGVYAAMLAGGVAGLGIGNALAPRVDVACLQRYLTVFLAMASAAMVTSAARPVVQLAVVSSAAAAVASWIALVQGPRGAQGRSKDAGKV